MIWIDGDCAQDYGVRIVRDADSVYAARDVETEEVPGRNGAIVYDNGAFRNVTQTYTMYIPDLDKRRTARYVAAWLLSHADGYYRLVDDYEPDVYRMARFVGPLDVQARLERYGTAQIDFDCKPQRFLSGSSAEPITVYPVVGGYLDTSGGPITGSFESDRRTGFILASAGDVITVEIGYDYAPYDGAEVTIAAYDDAGYYGQLVSIETYAVDTTADPITRAVEYTVPSGATAVVAAWRSAYAAHVRITTKDSSAAYTDRGPVVQNPTLFDAAPLFRLRQTDSVEPGAANINTQGFTIGNVSITIVLTGLQPVMYNDERVLVDCDAMTVYGKYIVDTISLNSRTTVYDIELQEESDKFPVLAPGENVVDTVSRTMGGVVQCPITEIVIEPRWWTP